MKDFGERSNRVRNPKSSIRQRLRNELRKLGIKNRFRTDQLRNGVLLVIAKERFSLPFNEFEGNKVNFILRSKDESIHSNKD